MNLNALIIHAYTSRFTQLAIDVMTWMIITLRNNMVTYVIYNAPNSLFINFFWQKWPFQPATDWKSNNTGQALRHDIRQV